MDEVAEKGKRVSETLVQFKATLQAAVKEVHVDVSAFKQRIERRIEEMCLSNEPLAEAVTKLQEENQQLRAKLEALNRLVESLCVVKAEERGSAEAEGKNETDSVHNGHSDIKSDTCEERRVWADAGRSENGQLDRATHSEPSGSGVGMGQSAPAVAPTPPPWRAKRQAEVNVSIQSTVQYGYHRDRLHVDCNV